MEMNGSGDRLSLVDGDLCHFAVKPLELFLAYEILRENPLDKTVL